jgi:hypothetical protein
MDSPDNGRVGELESKVNAMLSELRWQRDLAMDRCVAMAGEIAILKAKLASLSAQ